MKYNKLEIIGNRIKKDILCICECGNKKMVNFYHLRAGRIISCGCQMKAPDHIFIDNIEYKKCTKCTEVKVLNKFPKQNGRWDNLHPHCKTCRNTFNRINSKKNNIANPDKKEKEKERSRLKSLKHKERMKTDSEYAESYKSKKAIYYKERRKRDINFRIKVNLRNRLRDLVKDRYKSKSSLDLLGCSIEEFKKYLETKFEDKMSWLNYGSDGWVMDHIIPCSYFNLTDLEQQQRCFHYTNIQPLWYKDNSDKRDKLDWSKK